MRVLVSDKIDEKQLDLFTSRDIKFDYLPEITTDVLKETIGKYHALIVRSRTKVTKDIVHNGKLLKVIGRVGSGVDNIDLNSAKQQKIIVTNAPDANSQAVAEHVVGLMFALLRHYKEAFFSMENGQWLKKQLSGQELNGKTVGIVGYGNIGQKVDKFVSAFGAKTLVFSRSYNNCNLADLFSKSDIITIHLSLNPQTKNLINENLLSRMKPEAFFINTSRGEVIKEEALFEILEVKKIMGAALDVYTVEPLPSDSRWRKLDNCILTPHIGASTKEALVKASQVVIEDVIGILQGKKAKFPVV